MINKKTRFLVVGLGLMGGSFALGLSKLGYEVTAIDINRNAIEYAKANKIISSIDEKDEELIKNADVIILGLYPKIIVKWIQEYKLLLKDNVLITDVTGIKTNIVDEIQNELLPTQEFISMHPMCGKETSGVEFSNTEMFLPANLIIVPTDKNTEKGISFIKDLGEELKFNNIEILSISEHDKMISFLSQLPHAIAVSLMDCKNNDHLVRYTGDSFRDLTRIAKINPELWSELFIMNKENLIEDIDSFINTLNDLKIKVQNEDKEGLEELFVESKKRRLNFEKK